MQSIWQNAEAQLFEVAQEIRSAPEPHYAISFYLSGLQEHYRSEFQLKIAVNVLNDVFGKEDGAVFVLEGGDIVVIYQGDDRRLLDKAIFQLRYLFIDDPLAHHEDGSINDSFCMVFDINFQWTDFYEECLARVGDNTQKEIQMEASRLPADKRIRPIDPKLLSVVEAELNSLDIGLAFRSQPVCAIKKDSDQLTVIFNEIYTHISHLKKLLSQPIELLSNRWLFKYLTEILDRILLKHIGNRAAVFLQRPVSLNVNVDTILSEDFSKFTEMVLKGRKKNPVILEIDIADVFLDMQAFQAAKTLAQEDGFKICLDGLTAESLTQIDRANLGFDLAKLQWNMDLKEALSESHNKELVKAVKRCGSNRIILCRCDTIDAIAYGHALGISLFQGRYTDSLLHPEATILN